MAAAALLVPLAGQEALSVRISEGAGIVYPVGSRSARGVTVLVTDAAERPVEGASVSFQLPERGPSGEFPSGGRTEIARTNASGTASVFGMRWNRLAGPLEIRITAAKGAARGSAICRVELTTALSLPDVSAPRVSSGHKWVWITLAVAGAAGGGLAAGALREKSVATPAAVISPPVIGAPSINLGRP
jgi:hypothetical protein